MAASHSLDDESSKRPNEPLVERYRDDPSLVEDGQLPPLADPTAARPSWRSRVQGKVPPSVQRVYRAVRNWVVGPQPPRIYKIRPFFPSVQHAPLKLLNHFGLKRPHRIALLIFTLLLWLMSFSLLQWKSSFAGDIPGYGSPTRLWCGARYWEERNGCGVNGDQCRPFTNSSLAFRCPANCASQLIWSTHPVGDQDAVYKQLVVGGASDQSRRVETSVYRGDSFICPAAIHAGVVANAEGGCGVLELIGEEGPYPSQSVNNIASLGFDSYFVQSFRFVPGSRTQCKDLRWPVMIVSAVFTVLIGIFTTSPNVFFWSSFVILFATTALATDPPNLADYASLLSMAASRFLPGCFCMAIMARFPVRYALTGVTAQLEKSLWWLLPAWVGALNNYTFANLPLRRLTTHDVQTQPGAVATLVIMVLIIFAIALGQAWCFRVEGRMPRYLRLYILLGGSVLLLLAIPGVNLRIHHYILALLLLPGTAIQTRFSLAYQGLLVGLFVNGVARWGFASIIETPDALFGGDNIGSLLPAVVAPLISAAGDNITFTLGPLPNAANDGRAYDGISVLVNDVERLRTYADVLGKGSWANGTKQWTWLRHRDGLPEYFRFAYMMGKEVADYTRASLWLANGTWIPAE